MTCAARSRDDLPRHAIAIVHYRAYADLKACLESVRGQTLRAERVLVLDVEGEHSKCELARASFPEVCFVAIENRGFAGGANVALRRLGDLAPKAEFDLLLNPDVQLAPDFCARLLEGMRDDPRVALGTGKLVRPDTGRIDSAGIVLPAHRRPRDRGSDEPDHGQYDRTEPVFGVSGAAMMLRRAALEDLAVEGQIFDEDFFLYHEDTDLAWRAALLGWLALYVPAARALHVRGWRREKRHAIAPSVRRHSFKNHYLQIIKNERLGSLLRNLPSLLVWEIARLGFALLRDRALLPAYRDAWRLAGSAWRKRRIIQRRARLHELE